MQEGYCVLMLKDEYKKQEKINGIIYNEDQSSDYRHAIVNGNIFCVGLHLKKIVCNTGKLLYNTNKKENRSEKTT